MVNSDQSKRGPWPLWLCDQCGEIAEAEPGTVCEYCEGIVRDVQVVPVAEIERLTHERDRAVEQRENANAVSVRVEGENRRLGREVERLRELLDAWEAAHRLWVDTGVGPWPNPRAVDETLPNGGTDG